MGNLCSFCPVQIFENSEIGIRKSQEIRNGSEFNETSTIRYKNTNLFVLRGDITEENVDAIVNVQNKYLNINSNLSLMLSQQGGDEYTEEINSYKFKEGEMKVGSVMYTHSGQLTCDYILHTCLPQHKQTINLELKLIFNLVQSCLNLANKELKLNSIAFPSLQNGKMSLSTTHTAIETFKAIKLYLEQENKNNLNQIYLVLSDSKQCISFQRALFIVFGEKNDLQSEDFKSFISDDLINLNDREKDSSECINTQQTNASVFKSAGKSQKYSF